MGHVEMVTAISKHAKTWSKSISKAVSEPFVFFHRGVTYRHRIAMVWRKTSEVHVVCNYAVERFRRMILDPAHDVVHSDKPCSICTTPPLTTSLKRVKLRWSCTAV